MHVLQRCCQICFSLQNSSLLPGPQLLINNTYDACIDSTTLTTVGIFQIWKQIERGYTWRIRAMGNCLEAAFSRSRHSNLRGTMYWLVHYLARAEHLESIILFLSSQSLDAVALVVLHNMHHLSCDLPQHNPPL